MDNRLLTVLTSLPGNLIDTNTVSFTEKFVEGMNSYVNYWQGPVKVVANLSPDTSGNLDHRPYRLNELDFEVSLIDFTDLNAIKCELKSSSVVQGGSMYHLNGIAQFCLDNKIVYIHCSEYTLKTRLQIVKATTSNPVLRFRRYFWEWNQEKKNRKEIKLAAAAQCNGVPVYDEYKRLSKNVIIYFDNRINQEDLASELTFRPLPAKYETNTPIQLAFSGRLDKTKGADAILRVAYILKQRNLPFEFHIFGGGTLEREMQETIKMQGLSKEVRMHGILDFSSELVPTLKKNIDLFVCCHVQGDPSCTYVETFACGVPIIGYLNEAFDGILKQVDVGWGVQMFDDVALADQIEKVINDPTLIEPMRKNALGFAADNTFHKVFSMRIAHMKQASLSVK